MTKLCLFALVHAVSSELLAQGATEGRVRQPDTVVIQNGALRLRALLWRPQGSGPFPAVLFSHGSGPAELTLSRERTAIGPVFARHGYAFLFLHRRGSGLSASLGANSFDVLGNALATEGQAARNRAQMRLLEGDDLSDAVAALAFLRALPDVDPRRIALVGHSFGGSLSLILAARDTTTRASVVFGPTAGSWAGSPELQARLRSAVASITSPVFFIHAANDLSTTPGKVLAAEMQRLGKAHRLEIYPPLGRSTKEGHDLIFLGTRTWESDVFAFLDARMRRSRAIKRVRVT